MAVLRLASLLYIWSRRSEKIFADKLDERVGPHNPRSPSVKWVSPLASINEA